MRLWIPIAIAAGLSACAHHLPPEPVIQTVEVKVPVPQPCKAEVAVHQSYTDDTALAVTDIFEKVRLLLIGRSERKEDDAKLRGAVIGCGGSVK